MRAPPKEHFCEQNFFHSSGIIPVFSSGLGEHETRSSPRLARVNTSPNTIINHLSQRHVRQSRQPALCSRYVLATAQYRYVHAFSSHQCCDGDVNRVPGPRISIVFIPTLEPRDDESVETARIRWTNHQLTHTYTHTHTTNRPVRQSNYASRRVCLHVLYAQMYVYAPARNRHLFQSIDARIIHYRT